jgi:hypothetical protein
MLVWEERIILQVCDHIDDVRLLSAVKTNMAASPHCLFSFFDTDIYYHVSCVLHFHHTYYFGNAYNVPFGIFPFYLLQEGAVGWGTALQTGRSRVRFRRHYDSGVDSASNINEDNKYFLGDKGGRCVDLTTLPSPCADCLEVLGVSNSWSRHSTCRPVTGIVLPFTASYEFSQYFVFLHLTLWYNLATKPTKCTLFK